MLLFKTSQYTFKTVIEKQKHAFEDEPKNWEKGEMVLISKNVQYLRENEKQIQYIMYLQNIRYAEWEELEKLWPHVGWKWNYIADCERLKRILKPFNVREIVGKDAAKKYLNKNTFQKIPLSEEKLILEYLFATGSIEE